MTEWGQDEEPTRKQFVSRTKRVFSLLLAAVVFASGAAIAWLASPRFLKKEPGSWKEVIEERYVSIYQEKYCFLIVMPPGAESSRVSVQVRRMAAEEQRYPSPVIQAKEADEIFDGGSLTSFPTLNGSTDKRIYVELLNTRMLGIDETTMDPTRIFVRLESGGNSTWNVGAKFYRGEKRGYFAPEHVKWMGNELRFLTLHSQDTGGKYKYDFVVVLNPPD